jgi:hypothetical protein
VETCPVCGQPFEAERCPFCEATRKAVIDFCKRSTLVSGAGLVAGFFLDKSFPLLEWPLATSSLTLALFFAPVVFLTLLMTFNRRFGQQAARIKRVFVWTAALLIMFVAFCFLNVALDKQPPIEVPARVVSKESGRASRIGGTAYILQLSLSWDQQQLEAECSVSPQKFSDVEPGDLVHLIVHPGAFSLAWHGDVLE